MGAGLAAGALLGVAVTFKYNAAVYAPAVAIALAQGARVGLRDVWRFSIPVVAGMLIPIAGMLAIFAAGSALGDLYAATITYNLQYSGETYSGASSFAKYLIAFPVRQARVDALWTLGGLGCIILVLTGIHAFLRKGTEASAGQFLVPLIWVAAACLSIAINGSRGLPQYFVQAAPALALAAGIAAIMVWPARRASPGVRLLLRVAGLALVSIAAWRVTDFPKIPRNAAHDLAYLTGRLSREEHLARYGGRAEDKYVALAVARLGDYLRARTTAAERIYIFGFSPGAYVKAGRVSASRFFWSRPVLVGFNAETPGYGAAGLLDELRANAPSYVVLQAHDWAPPPGDSATFFMNEPRLGEWLRGNYRRAGDFIGEDEDYDVWVKQPDAPAR